MNETTSHIPATTKPKIMFCTTHWFTGGMERKMANLFCGLVDLFDVYLLTVGDKKSMISIPQGVINIVITEDEYRECYSDKALNHIKNNKIDIVIGVLNLFHGQLDLYEKCHKNNIRTIAANSEYFYYPHHNERLFGTANRRQEVFKLVDVVLWQTNFSAAAYSLTNNNGFVMPNPNTFLKQSQISEKNKKIILCVGRFNDYIKRIDRILACYKIILDREPKAELWVVGQCGRDYKIEKIGNKSINDIIDELCLEDGQITFFGEVSDVEKYYMEASVLLVASENEGFSNVINEAASFGVPVVCNAIPGVEDLIEDGCNGFISAQDDIEKMAVNVCKILSNKKLRDELGYNAFCYVDKFSPDKIIQRWEKLINVLYMSTCASTIKDGLGQGYRYKVKDDLWFYETVSKELSDICNYSFGVYGRVSQQLDCVNANLGTTKRELINCSKELDKVIHSNSWKLTKPARVIKLILGKVKSLNNKRPNFNKLNK